MREGGPAPIPQRFDPVPHATQERQVNAQPGEVCEWAMECSLVRKLYHRGSPPDGRHESFGGVLNVEIRHSMPPINTCFIKCKTFGGNHHLHFRNTTPRLSALRNQWC